MGSEYRSVNGLLLFGVEQVNRDAIQASLPDSLVLVASRMPFRKEAGKPVVHRPGFATSREVVLFEPARIAERTVSTSGARAWPNQRDKVPAFGLGSREEALLPGVGSELDPRRSLLKGIGDDVCSPVTHGTGEHPEPIDQELGSVGS